ncbi:MAG: hypothetical protein NZ742_12650 [Acidobacteria bacterium]|nr:hypothetical protein [Acidobacteriota bacterium]MDW7985521.1 hypothetical protein [Acidobacteriota bacterium]
MPSRLSMRPRLDAEPYHPYFQAAVQALEAWRVALERGAARPEDIWAGLMGWLADFMSRVRRWDSYYLVEWDSTPVWLQPDRVPLGTALQMAVHVLERMAEQARGTSEVGTARSETWIQLLVDLMPWVVWGGSATPAWYRCIVATHALAPDLGERLLERLYETARQSDDEAIRLLARGAIDFFRLRKE